MKSDQFERKFVENTVDQDTTRTMPYYIMYI